MLLVSNILLLVGAAAFAVVAYAAGDVSLDAVAALLRRAGGRSAPAATHRRPLAPSLLAGYGVCALGGVVLGLAHLFYWWSLGASALALVLASRQRVLRLGGAIRVSLGHLLACRDPLWLLCLLITVVEVAAMFAASLAPPVAVDELAYHLPEARLVATEHHLPLNLGDHFFYGNIPHLFEVLFAEGIAVGNDSFAHLLHASVFAAFLGLGYSVVERLYGSRPAIVAAAVIATIPEATANAQTMYVDTATASFECGALICALAWLTSRDPFQLAAASLLSGFALSGKYSSVPTVVCVGALVAFAAVSAHDRRRSVRVLAVAAGVALAVCGFWYAKNAVLHGNPFYPLYLGHRGVSEEEYRSLVQALQHFGPRTLDAFVHVPASFSRPLELPTFLLFFVAPAAMLVRRRRVVAASLGSYFVLYVPYWFFLATHQTRFLLPAFFVGSIAAAIVAFAGGPATRSIALVSATFGLFALHPSSTLNRTTFVEDVRSKLSVPSLSYATGRTTRDAFLARQFGCQYRVVRYLARNHLRGGVVDNWSRWYGYNLVPYMENDFAPLPRDLLRVSTPRTKQALGRRGFEYLYVRRWDKLQFALASDPIIRRWRRVRLPVEARLLRDARVVYRVGDCSLYRLAISS